MKDKIHIFADNYLRNLHDEIYKLETNQTVDDFINFFVKDDVFTIGLISSSKEEISNYINEVREVFDHDKKLVVVDLDKLTQQWNEIIYSIKKEKSLESYFYQIIKASIVARKIKNEKIGKKEYDIDDSFYVYDLRKTESLVLISNNSLLLKTESQRMGYVHKYIDYIKKITNGNKKRTTIPKKIKEDLWNLYNGRENAGGDCYVCKDKIHITNFEAGHVDSVSNGGETSLRNLRPICGKCNKSMGEENLYSYKKKYYPEE